MLCLIELFVFGLKHCIYENVEVYLREVASGNNDYECNWTEEESNQFEKCQCKIKFEPQSRCKELSKLHTCGCSLYLGNYSLLV